MTVSTAPCLRSKSVVNCRTTKGPLGAPGNESTSLCDRSVRESQRPRGSRTESTAWSHSSLVTILLNAGAAASQPAP